MALTPFVNSPQETSQAEAPALGMREADVPEANDQATSHLLSHAPSLRTQEDVRRSLRQDSLRVFELLLGAIACFWILYLVLRDDMAPISWIAPFGLLSVTVTCYGFAHKNEDLACAFLPMGLAVVLITFLWFRPGALTVFLAIPIVLISSVILAQRWVIGIAAVILLALALVGWQRSGADLAPYAAAALTIVFTVLVAWFATRNLYTALEWAMYSQEQARASIAELRERRATLRQLSDMLRNNQERLHYLNIHLEQAKVAAEEAYRTKQHFVANVSHELRTPLSLITGFSEMMAFSPESYGSVRLPPEYHGDVMEIYRSSKHLLGLVEDVLALAQLEAGQMIVHRDWSDIVAVIRDATDTMRPLIEPKGLHLTVSVPKELPAIYMDAGRIRQILLNLLNNAFRYTERGGISVRVQCRENEASVEVSDTGVGIADEDLPLIFAEFHSLSRGPARHDGFGLGLSISRRLAEAHGGRLWAESTPGKGSSFYLALPLTPGEATSRPVLVHTVPHPRSEVSKPVVLAVGEEEGFGMLDRYLGDCRVVHVAPEQAAQAYEQYLPVAIWVNEQPLPQSTPCLEPIVKQSPSLPIIRCCLPSRNDIARRLRADRLVPKPITREQLLGLIGQLSEERRIGSILIVDDDPHMVKLLQRMLTTEGQNYRVIEACGGKEGLNLLASEHPDLVLLDLAMPSVSGYDVLGVLQSQPEYSATRVVLMTGVDLEESVMPIYAISAQNLGGFSLLKSFALIKLMIEEFSPRGSQVEGAQSG